MEQYLRSWRQDAFNRGQHECAIYIGDKVLALTDSDADAFWLAQVHFSNNNFSRALALLSRGDLVSRNPACQYLAAYCYIKQDQFDQALSILGEHNPTDLIRDNHSRRKIQHLGGQSHVTLRNGKSTTSRDDKERDESSDVKFEASMCYLRGLCFAKQNAFDRARDCYKDAVRIDVQCFEAFDQLMKNSLMSPKEELDFLESLDFDAVQSPDPSVSQEAADFTKMLYTTRLSKYSSPTILSNATETLSTHYNLASNPDIILSRAETLFTQCRFAEALELTSSVLSTAQSTELHAPTSSGSSALSLHQLGHTPALYPIHLACLYQTGATNALFLLAHLLADHAPDEPYTYLAIGIYYLAVSKIAEARRFFSKASLLDPHSPHAWIGFAHTFAAEGEHDQAIAAYSTAARLFQGSHLPQLYLGMQHLALSNLTLAYDYLKSAYEMSTGSVLDDESSAPPLGGDPLVLNELGVVLYNQDNLAKAVVHFRQALALAESLNSEPGAWVATRSNLGHALRRMGHAAEALEQFDECLRISASGKSLGYSPFLGGGPRNPPVMSATGVGGTEGRGLTGVLYTSKGFILLELGRTSEAVTALHEAVRILGASGGGDAAGSSGVAGTLLTRALEIWAIEGNEQDERSLRAMEEESQASQGPPSRGGRSSRQRGTRHKERSTTGNSRRHPRTPAFNEGWTDEVTHTASVEEEEEEEEGVRETMEGRVEMELDQEADGLLHRALGRVRQRRLPAQTHQTPVSGRGTRHTRTHSRQ